MRQKYRRMEDQKQWPGLHLSRILLKEEGLNQWSKSGDVLGKLV